MTTRSPRAAPAGQRRSAASAAPKPQQNRSETEAAKRRRLAELLREVRAEGEQLSASADRLLARLA